MRNVIQLGLHTEAEWAYLTQPGWIEAMGDERKQHKLPDFFKDDPEPFQYFGLDISPSSVAMVREKYKELSNAYFIACGLGDEFSIENTPNRFYTDTTEWYDFNDERKNTLFVVAPFSFVINNLGVKEVSVLAMDIDGYEHEVLSTFGEWEIHPDLITTEICFLRDTDVSLLDEYKDIGYTHIGTVLQYAEEEVVAQVRSGGNVDVLPYLHECQFLRNDLYEQHKDVIEVRHEFRTLDTKLDGIPDAPDVEEDIE